MDFNGVRITVVGMGRSGMAAVRVLHRMGACVTANDSKSREMLDEEWLSFLDEEGTNEVDREETVVRFCHADLPVHAAAAVQDLQSGFVRRPSDQDRRI